MLLVMRSSLWAESAFGQRRQRYSWKGKEARALAAQLRFWGEKKLAQARHGCAASD